MATLVINDAVNQRLKPESENELFSTIPNTNEGHNIQLDTEEILKETNGNRTVNSRES